MRMSLVAFAALAFASSALALDPEACAQTVTSARDFVASWDRKELPSLIQTFMMSEGKKEALCSKLGLGDNPNPTMASPTSELLTKLNSVGGCLGTCASGSCMQQLAQLKGVTTLACSSLKMLNCEAGIPEHLQEKCDALNPTAEMPMLGAARVGASRVGVAGSTESPAGGANSEPSMPHATQIFLLCIIAVPMAAALAQAFKNRRSTAVPHAQAPAAAAASSGSEMI